jgi:flagellar basal-body rod modification protein FlgD
MTTATSATSSNSFTALTAGTGASATTSSASAQTTGLATATTSASNAYNTFLTLLTTQLQNQDPLNPTDTTAFTTEMIQLSSVEQELQTNQTLSSISTDLTSISAANGLGYVGKTVTAAGATSPMQSGTTDWTYTLNSNAADVTLQVQDANGNTLYTGTGDTTSGQHSFSWNGQGTGGATYSSGDYTLLVTATDSSGAPVTSTINLVGQVTGVDTSGGQTQLEIGDINVPVTSVTAIN